MPFFAYKVKNEHGETVKGKVEAKTQSAAVAILRNRGLLVISVTEHKDSLFGDLSNSLSGAKQSDIVNFTRQLSTMVTAGLPLNDGLAILEKQSKPAMQKVISDLMREIEGGSTFAKALQKQEKYFSKVYVQLVKAGETGGVLDEILQRLAQDLEKAKDFRSKTQGALIYPVIVLVAMVVVMVIMMIFVVPKLTDMYKDFGAQLPFMTQLLISVSDFFVNFWWVGLLSIGGGFAAFKAWVRTQQGKQRFHRFMLRMPLMGVLRQKIILTDFARTLSLLLGAGVSLLEALRIVNDAVSNVVYKEALDEASAQVEKGISLGQAIAAYDDIFPPILSQMVMVGEETGKLDEVLLKLSSYFQSESEQAVRNLTAAMEPMLMVVLGLGVGMIMIAIIMPIYNLTSQF